MRLDGYARPVFITGIQSSAAYDVHCEQNVRGDTPVFPPVVIA